MRKMLLELINHKDEPTVIYGVIEIWTVGRSMRVITEDFSGARHEMEYDLDKFAEFYIRAEDD